MSNFKDLKVGTPVCNLDWDYWYNYRVEAIGHDWAVLRSTQTGEISRDILEPEDNFTIGYIEETDEGNVIKEV